MVAEEVFVKCYLHFLILLVMSKRQFSRYHINLSWAGAGAEIRICGFGAGATAWAERNNFGSTTLLILKLDTYRCLSYLPFASFEIWPNSAPQYQLCMLLSNFVIQLKYDDLYPITSNLLMASHILLFFRAFSSEIAAVCDNVSTKTIGLMRMQFWRDTIGKSPAMAAISSFFSFLQGCWSDSGGSEYVPLVGEKRRSRNGIPYLKLTVSGSGLMK